MAVRNIGAIERKAEQMAKEKQERDETRRKALQVYLDQITSHQQEMIDAVDTHRELSKQKIPETFVNSSHIRFAWNERSKGKYVISIYEDSVSERISYDPYLGVFCISVTSATYNFRSGEDLGAYQIANLFYSTEGIWAERTKALNKLIQEFSEQLPSFLNNYFNFVDNL